MDSKKNRIGNISDLLSDKLHTENMDRWLDFRTLGSPRENLERLDQGQTLCTAEGRFLHLSPRGMAEKNLSQAHYPRPRSVKTPAAAFQTVRGAHAGRTPRRHA